MILFYRVIYTALYALLMTLRPVLPGPLRSWIRLRRLPLDKSKTFSGSYWFHASSGEIEYCKSVIRLLKERDPYAQIVVTYSSPSAEKLFHNIQSLVDQFIPLPWDRPRQLQELFRYLQPSALVFSRTDIWPELVHQARAYGVRTGIISYNPRFSSWSNFFNRWLLNQLDFISCVDERSKNRLHLITDTPITAEGDTRFDQVFYRLAQPPRLKLKAEQIFVCGSTWPEDEAVLFPAFRFFLDQGFKIVLSPHEVNPENIQRILSELARRGFSCSCLSESSAPENLMLDTDIFLVDRIGFLADCYRDAAVAFIGGSFREKVHSVMEALCCGIPVLVGPHYRNNPEAVRYSGRYVLPATNTEGLLLAARQAFQIDRQLIITAMRKNQHASKKVISLFFATPREK